MRLIIALSLTTALAACAGQAPLTPAPAPGEGPATAGAPRSSPLPDGRSGNLPANLWTTRLGGNRIEATVSDGSANLGVACVENSEIALRLRPAGTLPRGETTITLSSQGVRVSLPMSPDGDGNLRATLPSRGLVSPVLSSVADGAPLDVAMEGNSTVSRFTPRGARDALDTALRPGGCRA